MFQGECGRGMCKGSIAGNDAHHATCPSIFCRPSVAVNDALHAMCPWTLDNTMPIRTVGMGQRDSRGGIPQVQFVEKTVAIPQLQFVETSVEVPETQDADGPGHAALCLEVFEMWVLFAEDGWHGAPHLATLPLVTESQKIAKVLEFQQVVEKTSEIPQLQTLENRRGPCHPDGAGHTGLREVEGGKDRSAASGRIRASHVGDGTFFLETLCWMMQSTSNQLPLWSACRPCPKSHAHMRRSWCPLGSGNRHGRCSTVADSGQTPPRIPAIQLILTASPAVVECAQPDPMAGAR